MKCIHCGKTVADESRFCKYCGTRLRRTCAICGAAMDGDARFCSACGAAALPTLDFTKTLLDLAAAERPAPAVRQNDAGFYFSRRISRANRNAEGNCFDACGNTLLFVENHTLNRLRTGQELELRRSEISLDYEYKAVALCGDGALAAGFDWSGSEPIIMLWQYDAALNLRSAREVMRLEGDAERQTYKIRLTERHLFIFTWDNHDTSKCEILKCDVATQKLDRKQVGGKRIDLWYVDGERIYFRGESEASERFFGVLDTAPQDWTVRRIWAIGDGADQIPDSPVYCDFVKNLAWTAATPNERRRLGLPETAYVARELSPEHRLLPEFPVWQTPQTGAVNLFFDYFDGERSYKAANVLAVEAYDRDGAKHRWKNTLHGYTENVLVWNGQLIADFTSHGYRIYPATLDGPADVYKDGISVQELYADSDFRF